jgi:hypothetical protein
MKKINDKIKKIGKFQYIYQCDCGKKEITYYTDEPKIIKVKECSFCKAKKQK